MSPAAVDTAGSGMRPTVFQFAATGGISGRVDREAGVIYGVAVITGGVTARGHELEVDDVTLEQIAKCGQKKGRVQVKLNHRDPQALQSICGYVTGFRKEGNKTVADWHLLKSHDEFDALIERAERMPDCFGLSAAFTGPPKGERRKDGKKAARCEELLAVDCVPMPAANPAGLFESNLDPATPEVDTRKENNMEGDKQQQQQQGNEPTLNDVMAALQGIQAKVESIEARQADIEAAMSEDAPISEEELAELSNMDDKELAALGLTRAEVQAAVEAYLAEAGDGEGEGEGSGEGEGEGSGEGEGAAAAPATAALSALRKRVVELETKLNGNAEDVEAAEIMHAFEIIEQKQKALELQNEALQRTVRLQGINVATPGAESQRMFSAQEGDEKVTEFDRLVSEKAVELESKGTTKTKARLEALRFVMKTNPRAYAEHNASRGIVELAD
jgi:hypothetical protein